MVRVLNGHVDSMGNTYRSERSPSVVCINLFLIKETWFGRSVWIDVTLSVLGSALGDPGSVQSGFSPEGLPGYVLDNADAIRETTKARDFFSSRESVGRLLFYRPHLDQQCISVDHGERKETKSRHTT